MAKATWASFALNMGLSAGLVYLNMWALRAGLEETFVALALMFGLATTVGNTLLMGQFVRSAR